MLPTLTLVKAAGNSPVALELKVVQAAQYHEAPLFAVHPSQLIKTAPELLLGLPAHSADAVPRPSPS